jgi:4-amino-4-deoxy-L-arabinose transferase-like glycosyltransferase
MRGLLLEPEDTKYERAVLLISACIGILLRVLGLVTAGAIEMDGIEYAGAAAHFAHGEFGQALKGVRVPFYPLLTGLFNLVIPDVELAGRLVSLVAALLLIVFCFFMIRRLFGERTAIYATFFVTVHPYMIRFSSPVLSEALATFLFTVAVVLFYSGWVNSRSQEIGLSGLFLTLAYLTRPEYIIYFAPLTVLLLIRERRFLNTAAFLSCFVMIAFAFLIYIRMETGFWVIDKKMLAWKEKAAAGSSLAFFFGSLSATAIVKNIPVVLLRFGEAIFPPLLFLAILGFKRVEPRYRLLVIVLVATHVLGRSFVPHATKRYSVEFAPVIMVFAAQGIAALFDFFHRYRYKLPLFYAVLCIIAGLSLYQGIAMGSHGRELHKQAGLYLREERAGGSVASRLPILTFYARTGWVDLPKAWEENQTCEKLRGALEAGNVRYLAIDDRMKEAAGPIISCLPEFNKLLREFKDEKDYVRIYQQQSR